MKIMLFIWLVITSLFGQETALPSALNAWKSLSYVNAATSAEELPHASLTLNSASYIGLHNTPKVHYVTTPTNEGGTVSYGGMFQIQIKESGIYRIALGNPSWVDMIKDGKAAKSIAHQGGPQGSGIRKMLDYPLESGVYILQLSAGADSTTAVMITKIK
ncbi:MAG: hypothetical protein JXQ68_06400 [Campylobacterales bacterium]|nr:hypothetical protein [Campylobacterales bacterium]